MLKSPEIICHWDFEFPHEFDSPVKMFVDKMDGCDIDDGSKKVLILFEPDEINYHVNRAYELHNKFDLILTHNKALLDKCSNAKLFAFGSTWIEDYDFPEKEFSISHLTGWKTQAEGHRLRHKVWYKQKKIEIPKNFWLSKTHNGIDNFINAPILEGNKNPLFNSCFHLTIENCKNENFFTEKIIDCFQTKTIPIYWGCPNISEFFNEKGIIVVNDFKDIIKTINNLTIEDYTNRVEYIEENFKTSNDYTNLQDRVFEEIKKIL